MREKKRRTGAPVSIQQAPATLNSTGPELDGRSFRTEQREIERKQLSRETFGATEIPGSERRGEGR